MSFEFGMRPQGQITEAAEPEEYDVDEAEADRRSRRATSADLGAALSATNVLEVLDQLDRDLIALAAGQDADPRDRGAAPDRQAA